MTSTEISTAAEVMTLVNVFTVAGDGQQELIDRLSEASEVRVELPGFISADVHHTQYGERVVSDVPWRSLGDFRAMQEDAGAIPYTHRAAQLASYGPIVCHVVHVTHA